MKSPCNSDYSDDFDLTTNSPSEKFATQPVLRKRANSKVQAPVWIKAPLQVTKRKE